MSSTAEWRALIDAIERLPDEYRAAPSHALWILMNYRGAGARPARADD